MPCLFALAALIAPRAVIVFLWLLTTWFEGLFDTALWPILGFVFLPTTFLWYTAVQNWNGGEWGALQIVILVVALSIDVSPAGGRRR
ncbi:MAG: hypothetical protein JSV95_04050 [Gemmatimonadota bacterium]|jgi:hypothetical protein|nr:MAG: hypothetical protein JSV95_04050 [Gemmatimonadota bacterium]